LENTDGRGHAPGLHCEHVGKAIIKGFKLMAEMERLSPNPFCGILSGKMKKIWNIKLNSSGKLFLEKDGFMHLDSFRLGKYPLSSCLPPRFRKPHAGSLYLPTDPAQPEKRCLSGWSWALISSHWITNDELLASWSQ
jgi:hypothetical protein